MSAKVDEVPLGTTTVAGQAGERATLAACFLGMFVVTLDAVVVNVALPAIRADLHAGMAGLQWVVDGYTLAVAALLLAAGGLADRIGARTAFALGMVGFAAASAGCAAAPTLPVLLAARAAQGAAAALLMPTSMSLIGQAFPDPVRKARAVGLWAMGGAVASSAGPVLGGALATLDWRLIFWVNVPVAAGALVLLRHTGASPRVERGYDHAGLALSVTAMGSLTYAAIASGEDGVTSPSVLLTALVAVAAGVAFVLVERRARHPMLPLDLFRAAGVRLAAIVGFVFMVCYYGTPFVMSLLLQQARGLSSLATGVVFVPMMLVGLILTPFSARLVERFGRRRIMLGGLASMALGAACLALGHEAPPGLVAALLVLVGLGGPTVMPPATALLLVSVEPSRAGVASGMLNTSRQLGGALAVAVFGAVLSRGLVGGLPVCMAITAGCLVLAAGAVARLADRDT